jgi:hypothetical protein
MAEESRKPPRPSNPTSVPPDVPFELDSSWDDDTMPRIELDDPMSESAFDRVTAIPELPSELYAKQVMEQEADDESMPPSESTPRLLSEPPVMDVRPLDPMGLTPPPPPHEASNSDLEPTPTSSATSVTARPGRMNARLTAEPTGLELMDERGSSAASRRPWTAEAGRDPRDPVLELDLGEVARSGPPPAVLMPSAPASGRDVEITEMKDRYAMGDFTGALVVAEGLLEVNGDDIDAQRYAQSCRDVLTQMYTARLGSLAQRVRVAVPGDQIRWLSLDHRAGFVLSLIDGSSTVEELLDISGMNRLDALRILYTLYDQRVIALG